MTNRSGHFLAKISYYLIVEQNHSITSFTVLALYYVLLWHSKIIIAPSAHGVPDAVCVPSFVAEFLETSPQPAETVVGILLIQMRKRSLRE